MRPAAADKTGFVFLSGYFLLFCALLMGATAGWQAYRDHVESTRWPAVDAQLSLCHVHTSYDSWHGRARATHRVDCSFAYDVDDQHQVVTATVGNTVSVVSGQIDLTSPRVTLSSLRQWVARHPDASVATIHYDPARPGHISLVGLADDLTWQTPAGYAHGTVTFAIPGIGLLLLGMRLRRGTPPPVAAGAAA
jgi:hypothetical protein